MKYDYYLFDLDGCLLYIPRSWEYFDNILIKTLEQAKTTKIPMRSERNNFWFSGKNYINYLRNWGTIDFQNFWKIFDEIDYEHRKILIKRNKIFLFNDVKQILKEIYLDGKKTAIISNSADYIVKYILNKFNIAKFFHKLFGLSYDKDQAMAKPSPLGIISILNEFNFNPRTAKALMIGDSVMDIYAAKRAEIHSCLIRRDETKYPNEYTDWEHQPDYVIDNLTELLVL